MADRGAVVVVGGTRAIGLELVTRHPHRVSTLVAFEPSVPTLLDVDDAPALDRAEADLVGGYTIDSVALRASHVPVLPAAGRSARGAWTHRAAEVLARRLGWPLIEFQGDGRAFVTRPAGFAAQLAEMTPPIRRFTSGETEFKSA